MKRLFIVAQLLLLMLVSQAQDTTRIVILHSNDTHSKIDEMAKVAFKIDSIKRLYKNVYVFSAGDVNTGNPINDKYKEPGYPMIDLMNELGYDVSCFGNHEFDVGQDGLNRLMHQAHFPFVCANINTKDAILNQPKPFIRLKTDNGITIGVLGLIQLDDNGLPASSPLHLTNIKFDYVLKTLNNYKKYEDSADVLIALSHLGVDDDQKLAKKLPIFDAIVGGHSHTTLPHGIKVKNTLVVQTGSYYKTLGVLTILYSDGKVISVTDSLIPIKSARNINQDVQNKIDAYNNNAYFATVIGKAEEEILGDDELGALMTDAMIDTLHVDMAFMNVGGIRVHSIPKGNITIKNVLELSPFGNTFVVYNLTLKQIKVLIKYAYNLENQSQIEPAGVNIYLQVNKKGKLKKVILKDDNGKELADGTYSIAINNYMSLAYSLSFLKTGGNDTHIVDADNTMSYIKKKGTVNYAGVKRVFIEK